MYVRMCLHLDVKSQELNREWQEKPLTHLPRNGRTDGRTDGRIGEWIFMDVRTYFPRASMYVCMYAQTALQEASFFVYGWARLSRVASWGDRWITLLRMDPLYLAVIWTNIMGNSSMWWYHFLQMLASKHSKVIACVCVCVMVLVTEPDLTWFQWISESFSRVWVVAVATITTLSFSLLSNRRRKQFIGG